MIIFNSYVNSKSQIFNASQVRHLTSDIPRVLRGIRRRGRGMKGSDVGRQGGSREDAEHAPDEVNKRKEELPVG